MFFSEIKFYVRKEGSLNKYYCRRSKLTGFFEKLLRTYYLLLSSDGSSYIGKFLLCCCLSIHWLSFELKKGSPLFISQLMTIFMLNRMDFVIIWEMYHGMTSLNLVVLLLLLNFVNGCSSKFMYISLIINIKSSLISMVFSSFCCCHRL